MIQKYTKGQILNNLSKKSVLKSVRDKYRNILVSRDGLSTKKAASITLGQAIMKKSLAGRFAHKSERQIDKALKNEFGMKPEKRKQLLDDLKGGSKLTKHERNQLLKKLEKVKNRNLAMSKRQRDEFADVMGDDELKLKKSQKISSLRKNMEQGDNVKDTAKNRLGVNYRKGVSNFAGSGSRSSSSSSTGSKLGGDNPTGVAGGIGNNSGSGRIKF